MLIDMDVKEIPCRGESVRDLETLLQVLPFLSPEVGVERLRKCSNCWTRNKSSRGIRMRVYQTRLKFLNRLPGQSLRQVGTVNISIPVIMIKVNISLPVTGVVILSLRLRTWPAAAPA